MMDLVFQIRLPIVNIHLLRYTIHRAGFVVNTKKSVWMPQKCLEWLGFIWNMEEGCLELPSVKVEILLFMINNIVDNDFLGNC